MAIRNHPTHSRHTAPVRRAHKRRVRDEVLRHELELREHSPSRKPIHPPRLKTRSRSPLWKVVRRAVAVLMLVGLVELVVASLTAQPFQVKSFDVAGCELTDENQVELLSAPLIGQNWIRARVGNIEAEIAAIPTVESVHISRVLDWPPRLHVQVEERTPFAKIGGGEDWWVADRSGVAFRRANESDQDLYAVTNPKFAPALGSTLPEKQWRPVVEIADSLDGDAQQSWSLRRVYFDKDGSVSLRLAGGFHDETLVRLGGDHWAKKLTRARQALSFIERSGRHAAVVNLVSYEMPQWTPHAPQGESTSAANTGESTESPPSHSET